MMHCRLCLSTDKDVGFENILSCKIYKSQESLIDLIHWIYKIDIDISDPDSKYICINCIGLVENIVSSRIFFQQNQQKLKIKNTPERSQERTNKNILRLDTITSKPRSVRKDSRIKVKVADLSALNPFFVRTERLEKSLDFTRYKSIGNGAFKTLRYRQFRIDDSLVEDICNLLESGPGADADLESDLVQEINTVGQDLCRSDDSDPGSVKKLKDIMGSTKCLPRVCLEPVEFLLKRDSWEVVDDFTYKKTENGPDAEQSKKPEKCRQKTVCAKRTKKDNTSSNKKTRLENPPLHNGDTNFGSSKRITKHYVNISSANIVSKKEKRNRKTQCHRKTKCHCCSTARKRKTTKPKKSKFVWKQGLGEYPAISFYQTQAGNSDPKSNNVIRNKGLGSANKRLTVLLSRFDY